MNNELVKRVARTFVMTFIAAYGGTNLVNALGGSTQFDPTLLRSAGAAAVVAVVSLLWNIWEGSSVPGPVPPLKLGGE